MKIIDDLKRLSALLAPHDPGCAKTVKRILKLNGRDSDAIWRALNSNDFWGGPGSLADQALLQYPGMSEEAWKAEVAEFRELMVRIGKQLLDRGDANRRV